MGLKREALALIAGVAEKTIERAESGERVCERSSRRIATALGLASDAFTMVRFVPNPTTQDESQRHEQRLREEWERTHVAVTVCELRGSRDVLPLFGTHAFWCDEKNVAEVHLKAFERMKDSFLESNGNAAENVIAKIREFGALGYVVKGTVLECYRTSGSIWDAPSKWLCAYVTAFKKSNGVKDVTPVEGWISKMKLMKLSGALNADLYPGDESTVWAGRDLLGVFTGDANACCEVH
jgi:transcriptional regulator with XRE-family HTH domain